jgi:hypothetical protein
MAILQGSDDSPSGGGLSNLAHIVIEKVKTQSAINPLLWLCGVVFLFAMPGAIWARELVSNVCLAMMVVAVVAPIVAFFILMFRDPMRLQSEHYQLEHQRLHLLGDERSPGNIKIIDGELAPNSAVTAEATS